MLAAMAAGCSSSEGILGSSSPAPESPAAGSSSFAGRMNALFLGQPTLANAPPPEDQPNCPPVDIRQGASTLSVTARGDQSAMNLRYQATVAQTARECAVLGATMTMKVGIQGRIILGPAGGPGQLDIPMRIALVHEGPEPKTIWTKLYRVAVAIQPGQTNVSFLHVEEDLTVPTPPRGALDAYIVYVGFDQQGLKEQPQKRRRGG